MHVSYDDVLTRISEPPIWWLDGVPRYCAFKPDLVSVYAGEALLVHTKCQACGQDFLVGLGAEFSVQRMPYLALLNSQTQLGVGDPPNHNCTGDSMGSEEIAVVEFWRRFLASNEEPSHWVRCRWLERSLAEPDSALEEKHAAAWSRIRRFRKRAEGVMGRWTPGTYRGPEFDGLWLSLRLSPKLLNPIVEKSPTTGKFIDTPRLNQRRRVAMLALTGRITEDEFVALGARPQTEYDPYEARPPESTPDWARSLAAEVASIDEMILSNAIAGYNEMTPAEREERFAPTLLLELFELATSGRIALEERQQVLRDLLPARYR